MKKNMNNLEINQKMIEQTNELIINENEINKNKKCNNFENQNSSQKSQNELLQNLIFKKNEIEQKEAKILLNKKTVEDINFYMPQDKNLFLLADFFSMFSDPTRLKIISALSISEMCVSDISNILKINQTTVSHQLKTLKSLSMVCYRRVGKIIYYSLSNSLINVCLLDGVDCVQKYIS